MRIKQVIDIYEENHLREIQEAWDNTGIQVGDANQEVKNVLLTLEITPETIDEAIEIDCNLIISHHPVIFPNIKTIDIDHFKGNKLIKAIKNDIVIYASHTPSDLSGFNDYVFNKIGYQSQGKIVPINEDKGYGSFTETKDSLDDIIEKTKNALGLDHVILYGQEELVKDHQNRIGLITGSGSIYLYEAMSWGVNILITGDVNHHTAMDAMEQGVILIDISHEGSERLFADYVSDFIANDERLQEIKTFKSYNQDKYLRKIV